MNDSEKKMFETIPASPRRKVIIDHAKWRCGGPALAYAHGQGTTRLLNNEGYMCCLGFAAKQLAGLTDERIRGAFSPASLFLHIPPLTAVQDSVSAMNTPFAEEAIDINDFGGPPRKEREAKLTRLFDHEGIDLEFTGEYETQETE